MGAPSGIPPSARTVLSMWSSSSLHDSAGETLGTMMPLSDNQLWFDPPATHRIRPSGCTSTRAVVSWLLRLNIILAGGLQSSGSVRIVDDQVPIQHFPLTQVDSLPTQSAALAQLPTQSLTAFPLTMQNGPSLDTDTLPYSPPCQSHPAPMLTSSP